MVRTWLYSFAGAGVGFFVGFVLVRMMSGAQPASDTGFIILFMGGFLAGAGAVAGAIIGGVADLLEFFKRREQARREAQVPRESESEV
jgi:uncharacterized membrane-anchored protein YhcB (DUF1043 family)